MGQLLEAETSGTSTSVINSLNGVSVGYYVWDAGITVANTGGGYVLTTTEPKEQIIRPKQYSRAVLRKLEKLASEPLDEDAPEDQQEFMDWLHSD